MTYETLIAFINYKKTVKLTDIEKVLEDEYQEIKDDDSVEAFENICTLMEILEAVQLSGDQDDYHNVAVVCARNESYDNACFFLEKGLTKYPNSVDLLADFLAYGIQADKADKCAEIYNRLLSNKQMWNWRGYQFSINYLMQLLNIEDGDQHESTLNDLDNLTTEFLEKLPFEEEAYKCRADFLRIARKGVAAIEDSIKVLELVISDNSPIKRAPKCELKLADLYYDNGYIDKANDVIERCKISSLEIQQSVNRTYIYALSVLCKISLYYHYVGNGSKKYNNDNSDDKKSTFIDLAYEDYHTISSQENDKRVKSVKTIMESFIRENGKPYPYDDLDFD